MKYSCAFVVVVVAVFVVLSTFIVVSIGVDDDVVVLREILR